jgi:hypothetical protein
VVQDAPPPSHQSVDETIAMDNIPVFDDEAHAPAGSTWMSGREPPVNRTVPIPIHMPAGVASGVRLASRTRPATSSGRRRST